MKNLSIERLVSCGFVGATVVLMLLGGIAWRSATKADEASSQVMSAQRALTAAGQIMFNLTRAETAQHDYEIYGENYYLKRRDKLLLDVVHAVGEAEQLVVVPQQQEHLRQLKRLIAQRMETLGRDHYGRGNSNGRIIAAGFVPNRPVMEQIHLAVGQIVEMENTGLLEREAEHAFQRKVEYMSFALLGVILPLILFAILLRVRRAIRLNSDELQLLKNDNQQLADESRKKSEFLAQMSHELRTPINAVMGFSELLKDGRLGKLTKAQAEYIGDIYDNGRHLLSLVNNILDLEQIEAGKTTLDLRPVEISTLLENSISVIREKAAAQHIRLQLKVQPGLSDIHVDPTKARQILYNLLSNAVKFSPADGLLKLCVRHVQRVAVGRVSGECPSRSFPLNDSEFIEFLEISIADSGIGIPREGLERLFQSYSRIDSGTECKCEGTGLGLMLVKQMAELHGGTVAVESIEGQGSRFTVWLPLRTGVAAPDVSEESLQSQFTAEPIRVARKIRAGVFHDLTQQRSDFSSCGWWYAAMKAPAKQRSICQQY